MGEGDKQGRSLSLRGTQPTQDLILPCPTLSKGTVGFGLVTAGKKHCLRCRTLSEFQIFIWFWGPAKNLPIPPTPYFSSLTLLISKHLYCLGLKQSASQGFPFIDIFALSKINQEQRIVQESTCRFVKRGSFHQQAPNLQVVRIIHSPSPNNNSISRGFLGPRGSRGKARQIQS